MKGFIVTTKNNKLGRALRGIRGRGEAGSGDKQPKGKEKGEPFPPKKNKKERSAGRTQMTKRKEGKRLKKRNTRKASTAIQTRAEGTKWK